MKEFIQSLDDLPILVKVILAIPALDIIWGIYRVVSAYDNHNNLGLIISIILLFVPFMWILDMAMILLRGNVWQFTA